MAKFTLTNHGYMALGIYTGFKAAFRRGEMARHGVDYDTAMKEFNKVGLAKNNRVNRDVAVAAFQERFPGQLGSQTHQYRKDLGYSVLGYC